MIVSCFYVLFNNEKPLSLNISHRKTKIYKIMRVWIITCNWGVYMDPGMTLGGTAWSLMDPPRGSGKKHTLMYCKMGALIGPSVIQL